jgi:HK97 family phage major capsid protein
MKIEDIIAAKISELESARGRYDRARQDVEDILATAKAQNRSHLTESEDQRCEAAFDKADRAKAEVKKAESSLERANAIKAEDDEAEKRLLTVRDTNAGMRNRGQTAAIPAVNGAGVLYGAGSQDERSSEWVDATTGRRAALGRNERFADHEAVREEAARHAERDKIITGTHGSFAQQIRSLSTTTASAIVPTQWSFPIIDKARNKAVAFQAGATLVPMPSKVVQVGRLTVDPVASYRAEGSTVTATDPTLDFIQLTATTLSALTVVSMEFIQDAPDADTVVSNAISASMALALDQVIFYGQLAAGSEPPMALL